MLSEIRLALRTLSNTPVITGIAVLSLALGIGANTAMFSLFNQILLKNLPVDAPAELVNLSDKGPKSGSNSNNQSGPSELTFSYPMMRDVEKLTGKVFAGVAAHRYFGANVSFRGQTTSSNGVFVSGGFFGTYRVKPALGRMIAPSDDEKPAAHPVVVLSHGYWQRKLGGTPDVLNGAMTINGRQMTIIGVVEPDFRGVTLASHPDFYVPMAMREPLSPGWKGIENRKNYWLYIAARLMPGMSVDQAQNAANTTYRGIIQDVETPLQQNGSKTYMEKFRNKSLVLEPGGQGYGGAMRREGKTALILLLGITGFVLLIACANIANLLLARAANRSKEIAIRLSIGASRWQLVRQLLSESLLLGLMGGTCGLLVARWTLYLLLSMMPGEAAGFISDTIDPVVLLFALGISIFTGLLFGIFPALHSTNPDLAGTLKDQAGQVSAAGSAARFRKGLVVAQISLSLLLLISAGLFVKSLVNVTRVDLGIKSENVVAFSVSPELNGHSFERCLRLFENLEESLAAIPGVTGASVSLVPMISGSNWGTGVAVDGFEATPDTDTHSMFNEVGADFYRTLGIKVLAGRPFRKEDTLNSAKVAIVNEAFVRKFGLKDANNAVGKRMAQDGNDKRDIEIIGVVQDAKYSEVKRATPPLFFRPYRQDKTFGSATLYVRTALDTDQLMGQIRKAVAEQDPQLPVEDLKTLDRQIQDNVFIDRMITTQATAFASLATLLAAVGLYGVLAYSVARRTREIGIRIALGASGSSVRNMILKEVGIMAIIGMLIGVPTAFALSKYFKSLLFGLEADDPVVFAVSVVLLILVALIAGYLPAFRATRIDPMVALRYE